MNDEIKIEIVDNNLQFSPEEIEEDRVKYKKYSRNSLFLLVLIFFLIWVSFAILNLSLIEYAILMLPLMLFAFMLDSSAKKITKKYNLRTSSEKAAFKRGELP